MATAVLLHGGFWRAAYGPDLMTALAADLLGRGWSVVNLSYRRVGEPGGGWPGTFDDVRAGVSAAGGAGASGGAGPGTAGATVLATEIGAGRGFLSQEAGGRVKWPAPRPGAAGGSGAGLVVVIGHSAGGHLALWAAAVCRPQPRLAVAMAGVVDLEAAARFSSSSGAVVDLLGGGPDDVPDRYAAASPRALLPLGVPTLLVHGAHDDTVPVSMSEAYAAAARDAGDEVELVVVPDEGHFECLDPGSASWQAVVKRLPS